MLKAGSGARQSSSWLKWNLLLLLLLGALYGFIQIKFWWNQLSPQWQGVNLSWDGVSVEQLSFKLPYAGQQQLQLEQLELGWTGWPWPLDLVKAQSLKAQLNLQGTSYSGETEPQVASSTPALPLWLPKIVSFDLIEVSLPCAGLNTKLTTTAQTDCQLAGSLSYSEHNQQIQLQLANQQAVFIEGVGDLKLALKAVITPQAEQLQVPEFVLSLASSKLNWQQHQFTDLELKFSGRAVWHNNQLQVEATTPVELTTGYSQPALLIQQLQLHAKSLQLELDPAEWAKTQLKSELSVELKQLQQPMLNTLDWSWSGTAFYQQGQAQIQGRLSNSLSLSLEHKVQLAEQRLNVSWTLPEVFFLAGNPLQLGPFWPELLTLQKGKASGQGQFGFDLSRMSLTGQQTKLVLRDLTGIYDRTVFSGLSAQLQLFSQGKDWTVQTEDLKVQQINHGLIMGPLALNAVYNTTAPDWFKGRLGLKQLQLALFGGQVTAIPQQIDLTQDTKVLLQLDKLQLAELLKQHPSADMTGQGTLSGTLPLSIEQGKLTVAQGAVAALAPGGKIAYQSDKARAMAQSNQGMNIVVQALQNFHFSALSAAVSYSKEGLLLLALKLEGNNPDFEQGRAVNFSIHLEENLPAMITSLQLAGQVSDLVKKRVQQRLAAEKAKDARKE
ncbi:YdbH domain-containing protein [Rheinheimera sp.]|uniref:intermembrane phospholipid transport protein YdbH family protein n=1 Tax=Rheinheimera sp. TaxID=1869214 RepID=UPI002627EE95|nr:YdbH domain-containing protein [Rheinheimera sp.]MCA1929976.1 YdbH domain-containing protein [Rheinheimera sp.]